MGPHPRCPSSPNTSVKRTGARSPRGVSSSRISKPPRPPISSSSSPSPSLSTREASSVLLFFRLPSRWKEAIEFEPVTTSPLGRRRQKKKIRQKNNIHSKTIEFALSLSLSLSRHRESKNLYLSIHVFLLHYVSLAHVLFSSTSFLITTLIVTS